MPVRNYINTSKEGQLIGAIGTGDTTINLSGSGLVNIPTTPFYVRIDPDTASEEIVLVGSGSSATTLLNCTRGYDGTSAFSHGAGAKVRHVVVAEFFNKADVHVEATTNVHGLSGGSAVAGTTQTQTLTNKTINSSTFDVSHTTAPVGTQHYRVHANDATSRNGFVWDNTGGSGGRAFLVKVAGVDRSYFEGDGDLVVGGTTATTGLTNTGAFSNSAGITNTSGGITSTGTLTNTGNVEITGTIHSTGAADFDSTLNADGATTLQTTLAVTGNTTVGGTLGVTGASTLTGDVTLPLPGAGTSSRMIVNTRTGGNHFEGKNQSGTTTFVIRDSGRTQVWENLSIYNGSMPVVATVDTTATVTSPANSMVVFNDTGSLIQRYNGTTWVTIGRYGASNYIRYSRSTTQSISTATNTKANFTTADVTDTNTVTVASGTDFTLVKDGLYMVSANITWGGNSTGSRWVWVGSSADANVRYNVTNTNPNSGHNPAMQTIVLRRFTASTAVSVWLFQDSGGSLNLQPNGSTGPVQLDITWLGP